MAHVSIAHGARRSFIASIMLYILQKCVLQNMFISSCSESETACEA